MRLPRTLALYGALLRAALSAKLNYRGDFIVMVSATLLTQGIGYVFLWVMFRQLPTVASWTLPEVICVYAMIFVTEGFVSVTCEGLWGFPWVKHRGDFDPILVHPVSPLLQVLTGSCGINGLTNIALGAAMIAHALPEVPVDWTVGRVAVTVTLFVAAVLTRAGTVLISSALSFWIESPFNPVLGVVHNFSNFARFPLTIYGRALNLVLTFVVPFGFVSYYPVSWVFGKGELAWVGLLTPLVALALISFGTWLFNRGLNRYEASGN